ncbi:MAG: ornithine cyclodeaminase family protein [Actinobacteria bacterium]|nr:ornithine cyclodeaminase family protein [Actinomycetota bacterium]
MDLIYLSRADVEGLGMSMREVLTALDAGFAAKGRGLTEMPPKPGIHTRPDCFIHAMPAYVKELEVAGLKWVSGYPPNPAKGLPYISGLLVLNDCETGLPLAVMDCAWITAMRTGASAGISAKYLARPGSEAAAMVGCGVQARTSLMALVETLPALAEVRCYDLIAQATEAFITEMAARFPALRFVACASAPEAVRPADVVVTAIPIVAAPKPDLDAGMLKEGALGVSLDYDSAWTSAAMAECELFCSDDVGQLLATKEHAVYFGGIPDVITADLGELAAGLKPGRTDNGQRAFSMNMGIAVDDMVTAKVLYELAVARGAGVRLEL